MRELVAEEALAWLAEGRVLAYPTETVWGLGADARRADAVAALRAFKGRADTAPLSLLVTGPEALAPLGLRVDDAARRLAEAFWPGPLTLVLRCDGVFADGVAGPAGAVGVRCSPHPVARELAERCAAAGVGPLTATSCNRSGEPAAATRAEARAVCAGDARLALWAGGADAGGGAASTVLDLSGDAPRVLRVGALPEAALRRALIGTAAA